MSITAKMEKDLRECLKNFPLFDPKDELFVIARQHYISVGYNVNKFVNESLQNTRPRGAFSEFSLQIEGSKVYILSFQLRRDFWRKGLGTKLYRCVAEFCILQGCKVIETTPSGIGELFWPTVVESSPITLKLCLLGALSLA